MSSPACLLATSTQPVLKDENSLGPAGPEPYGEVVDSLGPNSVPTKMSNER